MKPLNRQANAARSDDLMRAEQAPYARTRARSGALLRPGPEVLAPRRDMMLCCPGTTAQDVDRHNAVFDEFFGALCA